MHDGRLPSENPAPVQPSEPAVVPVPQQAAPAEAAGEAVPVTVTEQAPAEAMTTAPPAEIPTEMPATPPPPPRPQRSPIEVVRSILHGLKEGFVRFYALILVLVLAWAGYAAFMSLARTVFVPQPVPARFLEWQGRIDTAALRAKDVPGVTGTAPRAPLAHFHRVERWFQPDPLNGCTPAGCHDPLPHTKEAKVPAFANFHTTFLACTMCHQNGGAPAAWVSMADGRRQDAPPLLRLQSYLETSGEKIRTSPQEAHAVIEGLLKAAVALASDDPALRDLLLQLDTAEPGSPVWKRAIDRLARDLPQHTRGEYGAKIAREATPDAYRNVSKELVALAALSPSDPKRKQVHERGAGVLLKEPVACLSCHGNAPAALDFQSLGYSPTRARFLGKLQLASLMQRIREGERFFIPKLLGGGNGNGNGH